MLRIVTDGAADMPPEWRAEYDIHVLPISVAIGDELFTPGDNFTAADFYRLVAERQQIPKSSLPSLGRIVDYYRSIASRGDEILSIHVAGRMSGTVSVVQSAARELADEFSITVFDSGAGSAALALMCREASLLARSGKTVREILARLEMVRQQLTVIFTLDTLEYAYLSGRISRLQSALSVLLQVKPIVVLKDGLLQMAEKVRTRNNAIQRVVEMTMAKLAENPMVIAVVHAADPRAAEHLVSLFRNMINVKEIFVTELAIPVAANLGPGTVGIVTYPYLESRND